MRMRLLFMTGWVCLAGAVMAAPIKIASLNPIVSDLARQVGGDDVEVTDLMPPGADPHTFYPSPSNLKKASRSALVLAAGKGLETYLDEFRQSLSEGVRVIEVGRSVPSLNIEEHDEHDHAHGDVDPHWWSSIKNAKRAAGAIAEEFIRIDPDHQEAYHVRLLAYEKTLDDLYDWAKKEIATIPRRDRELTTSHAAFNYMCRELGLRPITVQGLTTEYNPRPDYLKVVIKTLRDHNVRAVFPEKNANPKVLQSMVRETGVAFGGTLHAGTLPVNDPTYEAMMRHNITTIVEALRGGE